MAKINNLLGIIGPDPQDTRDILLEEIQPQKVELPEVFDLRKKMTAVQEQHYGSCSSHGVDAVKEYQESEEEGRKIKLANRFIYHNTKVISGRWDTQGDYSRNACKALQKFGVPLEKDWPDKRKKSWQKYVREKPSKEVYEKAKKFRAKGYARVADKFTGDKIERFKQAIYKNNSPISCSMKWYKSYSEIEDDGILPLPDRPSGGHAISCTGWNKKGMIFRNSWGADYGSDGYFIVPFNEFDKHDWWDAWILYDMENIDKFSGFVAGKYLKKVQKRSHKFASGDRVATSAALNLRTGPGLNRKIKQVIPQGDVITVRDNDKNGLKYDGYFWWNVAKGGESRMKMLSAAKATVKEKSVWQALGYSLGSAVLATLIVWMQKPEMMTIFGKWAWTIPAIITFLTSLQKLIKNYRR